MSEIKLRKLNGSGELYVDRVLTDFTALGPKGSLIVSKCKNIHQYHLEKNGNLNLLFEQAMKEGDGKQLSEQEKQMVTLLKTKPELIATWKELAEVESLIEKNPTLPKDKKEALEAKKASISNKLETAALDLFMQNKIVTFSSFLESTEEDEKVIKYTFDTISEFFAHKSLDTEYIEYLSLNEAETILVSILNTAENRMPTENFTSTQSSKS